MWLRVVEHVIWIVVELAVWARLPIEVLIATL
jgi:hypothetical protein